MKPMKHANQQLTDKDELTLNALEYICTTKFGKMDDLKNKIGKEFEVIVENISFDGKYLIGRTMQDVPEEDGVVYIKNTKEKI